VAAAGSRPKGYWTAHWQIAIGARSQSPSFNLLTHLSMYPLCGVLSAIHRKLLQNGGAVGATQAARIHGQQPRMEDTHLNALLIASFTLIATILKP
jgi:hypothetical protein